MQLPDYIILFVSLFMVVVSALQSSKEDVMEAFTGANKDLFKDRKTQGAELFLNRAMIVLSILFFAMIIWSNNIDRLFL